jgi:hypothetical protein
MGAYDYHCTNCGKTGSGRPTGGSTLAPDGWVWNKSFGFGRKAFCSNRCKDEYKSRNSSDSTKSSGNNKSSDDGGQKKQAGLFGGLMGGAVGSSLSGVVGGMMQGKNDQNQMPPPPPPQVKYSISVNGQQSGPFGLKDLEQMVQNGQITKETYVWKQGMAGWELACNVQELSTLFSAIPPPPPPPVL